MDYCDKCKPAPGKMIPVTSMEPGGRCLSCDRLVITEIELIDCEAEIKTEPDFVECGVCIAKPGSPSLCSSCVSNRRLIDELKRYGKELGYNLSALIRLGGVPGDFKKAVQDDVDNWKRLVKHGPEPLRR